MPNHRAALDAGRAIWVHVGRYWPAPVMRSVSGARDARIQEFLFFLKNSGGITKIGLPPAPPRLNAVGAAALRAVAQRDSGCGPWVFGCLKVRERWARAPLTRSLNRKFGVGHRLNIRCAAVAEFRLTLC